MASVGKLPDTTDLPIYAGDTKTFRVEVLTDPAGFIGSRVFTAQVRSAWDAVEIDATFDVTQDATGAWLTLSAEVTAGLLGLSTRRRGGASQFTIQGDRYTGVWDCQLAPVGGGDPTTTVCRGTLTVTGDVTRNG